MLINSPDGNPRHQTANLWQVIIIEMTVKRKSHLENFTHMTVENFWPKRIQDNAAISSLNTVTRSACDMAAPWPPPSHHPVGRSKKVLETSKNWPELSASVLIQEVLLDHPSHCLLPCFWPHLKYDPNLSMDSKWEYNSWSKPLVDTCLISSTCFHKQKSWLPFLNQK